MSQAELLEHLYRYVDPEDQNEMDKLMAQFDLDGDGELDFDEFKKMLEKCIN